MGFFDHLESTAPLRVICAGEVSPYVALSDSTEHIPTTTSNPPSSAGVPICSPRMSHANEADNTGSMLNMTAALVGDVYAWNFVWTKNATAVDNIAVALTRVVNLRGIASGKRGPFVILASADRVVTVKS